MESKTQKPKKNVNRWLFPAREHLHGGGRIILGLVVNAALASYALPQSSHIFDVLSHGVPNNMVWTFVMTVVPCAGLLGLLPVAIANRPVHRWLAIGLCMFPGYLAIATWVQLLGGVM